MKFRRSWLWSLAAGLVLGVTCGLDVSAAQHRATRLGSPATRFDTPLKRPEELRLLLTRDERKADVEAILQQAGWPGDVADLRRAAANEPIREWEIPTGTVMPFMSSREKGKPVALMEVLWAGKRPAPAYAFEFESRGQRYRCITPKACANFFVVDMGPVPPPPPRRDLAVTRSGPPDAVLCDSFPVRVTVANNGNQPLTKVRVVDSLADGLAAEDGRTRLELDAGDLAPGQGREFLYQVVPSRTGVFESRVEATCSEGVVAEATSRTEIRGPVLELACDVPERVVSRRPMQICLTVRNSGGAAEPAVEVLLPVPEGTRFESATEGGGVTEGRVRWTVGALKPGASRVLCVQLRRDEPGVVALAPRAEGKCAPGATAACTVTVMGIPAVLLEVVDVEDPVPVGQWVTYEIRVTNQGSAAIPRVRLECSVPENQEFVSGEGETEVAAEGREVRMAPLESLPPKQEATWRVTVLARGPGDTRFSVRLTGEPFATPIEEYEATTQY